MRTLAGHFILQGSGEGVILDMYKTRFRAGKVVRDPNPSYFISDEVYGEIPDPLTRPQRLLIRSLTRLIPAVLFILFFIGLLLLARP